MCCVFVGLDNKLYKITDKEGFQLYSICRNVCALEKKYTVICNIIKYVYFI